MAKPVEGGHDDDQNPCGIYISNLPKYVRLRDIREAFKKFGSIRDLYLPKSKETRMVRGIAYVEYDSPVQASEAMRDMQGKELVSRTISIDYIGDSKTQDEVRRRRVSSRGSDRHGSPRPSNDYSERRRSYSRNHSRSRSYSPRDRGHSSRSCSPASRHRENYDISAHHFNSKSPRTRPQEMRQKRHRGNSPISPRHSKSPHERPDKRKRQKRSLSPTLKHRENYHHVSPCHVTSKSSRNRPDERARRKSRYSPEKAEPVEGGYGDDQSPCGIYITNLPNYVRYEDIERAFRKFGPIRDIYLPKYEETRKVRGIAYVEYDSPVQASEAMRGMQGKELLDRTISIDYTGDYRARNEVWRRHVRRRDRSQHGSRRPYNDNLERGRSYSRNHSSSRSYSSHDRGHNSRKSYSPAPRHRERYHVSPHHSNSKSPRTRPQEMSQKRRRMSSSISPHHSKSPRERLNERKMQKRSYSPTPSSSSRSSCERSNERTRDTRSPSPKAHSSSADLSPSGRG